jgi:putative ABC transport system permease protein
MSVVMAPVWAVVRLLWQTVFLALGQVWANKIRAVLTALGIIIGVVAVVGVMSFLDGAKRWILSEFDTVVGSRAMFIEGFVPESDRGVVSWSDIRVSEGEARLLLDKAESIESITPASQRNWPATYGKESVRGASVFGVWASWHDADKRQVILGRPLSQIDSEQRRQVCLINEQTIEELKLDTDPVGEYILLNGRRFLIIGVLETKNVSAVFGGGQTRTELYIPYSTHKMMDPYSWTWFQAVMAADTTPEEAEAEIRYLMRNSRGLSGDDEDNFRMFVAQNLIDGFNNMASGITMVAVVVVGISLLVGGVGIMNIMLVSVSERTREIGLRKALGAKPPVVLLQFLVEAVVLCLFGGAIGLALGIALVRLPALIPDFPFDDLSVSPLAVVIGLGFCVVTGVLFGILPAIKAARLNPIDALRHE